MRSDREIPVADRFDIPQYCGRLWGQPVPPQCLSQYVYRSGPLLEYISGAKFHDIEGARRPQLLRYLAPRLEQVFQHRLEIDTLFVTRVLRYDR